MSQLLDQKLDKLSKEQLHLWKLRHTAEHVLHQAIKQLYPSIHLAMGPATEEGFYFDFDPSPNGKPAVQISEADFPRIEKHMQQIIDKDLPLIRQEISPQQAKKLFADNPYKQEWIQEIESRGEPVSIYWTGEPDQPGSMVDLCSGPHAKSTGQVKAFKLLSVAGAYWRGDEKNKMLTRIYGTAFPTQKELDQYLWQQEEAKKRDHRKIGQQQDLFLVSQDIGGGLPIFTPKGKLLRDAVENFIINLKKQRGYQFVWTPHIARSEVYKTSGHWQKYDAMFSPMQLDEEEYVLKPMNCPHHFQIFLNRPRSYRELPFRIAENGTCYRYEKSGELNGLLRVRSVTVDDTHTFVRHDQIASEIDAVLDLVETAFKRLGFSDYHARISIRDLKNQDKYLGKPEIWKKAEESLITAAKNRGMSYFIGAGEAAFYGPKIDVMVKDSLGREWQLSTCQLDFNQPENFDMNYIGEDGQPHRPAILHIAILGSLERFLGVLIEHYAGAFPVWLSPVQVAILPISEKQSAYAQKIHQALVGQGIRVELHDQAEPLQKRIRQAELQKIPYMLILGGRETTSDTISVRERGEKDLGSMPLEKFLDLLRPLQFPLE